MKILITGGLGYIGSHTVVELSRYNHSFVIVDNLSNSKLSVINKLKKLCNKNIEYYNIDVCDFDSLNKVFLKYNFDSIIHFAGHKSVSESIKKPLKYYKNNILSTLNLIELSIKHKITDFIFSSSATVYGNQKSPLNEDMNLFEPESPYGRSKSICEKLLIDASKSNNFLNLTILRYFNPVGAHPSGLIGEEPVGIPNNLFPFISKVASKKIEKLLIYGNDYDTVDGTGVRDYIHVCDLARGHILALMNRKNKINVYNLGTGKGYSVMEVIKSFEKINGIKINYKFSERRKGDLASVYSDVNKINNELGWKAKLSLKDMVKDAWNYEKNIDLKEKE